MKKALMIAFAGLLCMGSTAANAGVYIGLGIPGPAYYAPPPPPVYYAPPAPAYYGYAPQPVYYQPAPIWVGPGWYGGRYFNYGHYYYGGHGGYRGGYHGGYHGRY